MNHSPSVAIAGCGAVSAVGSGVDALRRAMETNASGLNPSDRFNHARYLSNIVGAAPRDGVNGDQDDPAHWLAAEAMREAAEEANDSLRSIPADRTGLVLATTKANIEAMERLADKRPCSERARRHLRGELLAQDLAAEHGARGPVQCVSLACVSGLLAIVQGTKLIQRGAADAVYVVGVDHLSTFVVAGFNALKALDPAGCRPFDQNRCGLSPGEAGAAMVLVRGDKAPADAVTIRGWGTSNDANHMTGPSRDGSGLAQAIRSALKSAELESEEIDYVNAHGTGTPFNDAMEIQALNTVFGTSCPPVSGFKGMLGHTLGAAGVVETILCVLAMQARLLPGTPRLQTPASSAPVSLLREPRLTDRLTHVLKLNVGFGGVNGALVLHHG